MNEQRKAWSSPQIIMMIVALIATISGVVVNHLWDRHKFSVDQQAKAPVGYKLVVEGEKPPPASKRSLYVPIYDEVGNGHWSKLALAVFKEDGTPDWDAMNEPPPAFPPPSRSNPKSQVEKEPKDGLINWTP